MPLKRSYSSRRRAPSRPRKRARKSTRVTRRRRGIRGRGKKNQFQSLLGAYKGGRRYAPPPNENLMRQQFLKKQDYLIAYDKMIAQGLTWITLGGITYYLTGNPYAASIVAKTAGDIVVGVYDLSTDQETYKPLSQQLKNAAEAISSSVSNAYNSTGEKLGENYKSAETKVLNTFAEAKKSAADLINKIELPAQQSIDNLDPANIGSRQTIHRSNWYKDMQMFNPDKPIIHEFGWKNAPNETFIEAAEKAPSSMYDIPAGPKNLYKKYLDRDQQYYDVYDPYLNKKIGSGDNYGSFQIDDFGGSIPYVNNLFSPLQRNMPTASTNSNANMISGPVPVKAPEQTVQTPLQPPPNTGTTVVSNLPRNSKTEHVNFDNFTTWPNVNWWDSLINPNSTIWSRLGKFN